MGHYPSECANVLRRMRLSFAALLDEEGIEKYASEYPEKDLTVISATIVNSNLLQEKSYSVAHDVTTLHPTLYEIPFWRVTM